MNLQKYIFFEVERHKGIFPQGLRVVFFDLDY